MPTLEDLMAMAQQAGGQGGGQPLPPTPGGGSGDILAQLQSLLGAGGGGGAPTGSGQSPLLQALATAQAGDPRAQAIPGGGTVKNMGTVGVDPRMFGTDMDLTNMLDASDNVRKDLPPAKRDGYTGSDSQEQILEDDPPRDDIGRKTMPWQRGRLQADQYDEPANSKKMSTEQELDMVNKNMGGPVEDGNFPSQKEIDALMNGRIDEKAFDAKWGKGAAAEMLDNSDPDKDKDPTTRKIPALEDDDSDHEYR